MTDILLSCGLVLLLIMVGGVFAAGEMALVSMRDAQTKRLAERNARGRKVRELASNPNRFLATVQIGVTLSGFLSAAFGEATLSSKLRPVLEDGGLGAGLSDVFATIIITLIVAYFALVVGELAPKRIALQRSERLALRLAPMLDRMARIARPAVWLLSRSTNVVVRALGGDPATGREDITEEELRSLVAEHQDLEPEERALIDDVFAASSRQVSEVMVPRTEVTFLEGAMTVSRAVREVADSPHSRYPVIGDGRDDIIGFVHIRDLLAPDRPADRSITVAGLAREVTHLPGTKKVLAALSEMRREGSHMAVVVDEYGGTDGVVTLEDLIEEIIGDIRDEYDVASADGGHPGRIDGEAELDGRLNLDEFAEATGLLVPAGPYETAAGYVMGVLGRIPSVGESVNLDGRTITVTELDGHRIARLTVARAPAGTPAVDRAG
ncbi:MAG: hemolysin family protein [Mycobacteriales bacterium]